MENSTITPLRDGDGDPTQLELLHLPTDRELQASKVHARFQLSRTTRERGLRHVEEIRRQLAEQKAARETSNVRRPLLRCGSARAGREVAHGLPVVELGVERQDRERARRHPLVEVGLDLGTALRR